MILKQKQNLDADTEWFITVKEDKIIRSDTPTFALATSTGHDHLHHENILKSTEYVNDIISYLRTTKVETTPFRDYMTSVQKEINPNMRSILVDWLVEVADEYSLTSETLFLTLNYLDRYLSLKSVKRNKLQLVGITCMLVASKYEEIYAPQVDDFCYITDNTYARDDILLMERHILDALRFELTQPTARQFLKYLTSVCGADSDLESLATYFIELALLDYGFLSYCPSVVASSALVLAHFTSERVLSVVAFQKCSYYSPLEIRSCIHDLNEHHQRIQTGPKLAVVEKYSKPKYKNVASLSPIYDSLQEKLDLLEKSFEGMG